MLASNKPTIADITAKLIAHYASCFVPSFYSDLNPDSVRSAVTTINFLNLFISSQAEFSELSSTD